MKGFFIYQLLSYFRSLKWIPPVVVYFIWVFVFYTYQGVPILSSYAVTSITLLFISTWITMGIFSLENESEKQLLFVQLSSKLRYLCGKWCICLLVVIPLLIFAIFYPILIQAFKLPVTPIHFGFTLYGHFYLALSGIFVGSLFSATGFAQKKYSWLAAMLVNIITIVSEGMIERLTILKWPLYLFPPIGKLISYFQEGDEIILNNEILFVSIWGMVYLILGFVIVTQLFLRKER
ncbi:hypothetical protein J14TS2_07090 [Bacillus sp. J14TS2]|uniref:hypothetical protein n=1 Tax=Bacillus sp. J14TS2 TaxID=2807188 RepID=UPI001B1C7864|nr:hypothetical protein [Bacillus sp. J14TS2]GIN70234.1 hypothetical protein J14TS2_07090 [Bacillus sp. J14TS2]